MRRECGNKMGMQNLDASPKLQVEREYADYVVVVHCRTKDEGVRKCTIEWADK